MLWKRDLEIIRLGPGTPAYRKPTLCRPVAQAPRSGVNGQVTTVANDPLANAALRTVRSNPTGRFRRPPLPRLATYTGPMPRNLTGVKEVYLKLLLGPGAHAQIQDLNRGQGWLLRAGRPYPGRRHGLESGPRQSPDAGLDRPGGPQPELAAGRPGGQSPVERTHFHRSRSSTGENLVRRQRDPPAPQESRDRRQLRLRQRHSDREAGRGQAVPVQGAGGIQQLHRSR